MARICATTAMVALLCACGRTPNASAPLQGGDAGTPGGPVQSSAAKVAATAPPVQPASACLVQNGEAIAASSLKAVGTEPFWGARVEGRCVTYLTPDDAGGTRVWTRFSGTPDSGLWVGTLGGKPFELQTSRSPSCSDGMSDRRYPLAVRLTVGGEQRTGCAEPLPSAAVGEPSGE